MSRVIGVTAVMVILCSAQLVLAQEGWSNPPPEQGTGGEESGWGQETETTTTTTTTTTPEEQQGTAGWGTPQAPQQNDTESATGGGTSGSGWGTQPTTTQQPAPQPTQQPAPPTTTTTTTPAEPPELTGERFRMAHRAMVGAHNHMSGAFLSAYDFIPGGATDSTTPWFNVSFMYTITHLLGIDIFAGMVVGGLSYKENDAPSLPDHEDGDGTTNFEMAFGARLLLSPVHGDRTRFYTGFGIAALIGVVDNHRGSDSGVCPDGVCNGWDSYGFGLGVPIGFEYRLRNAPRIAISMEVNLHLVFQSVGWRRLDDPDDDVDPISEAHYNRVIFGLGNPRQPGAFDFMDLMTFLTFGIHYML